MSLPDPLIRLIEALQRLPGIGPKGAQRLAFHLLRTPREQTDRLVDAVRDVKERVTYCSICNNITDADPCVYCGDPARDAHTICVVEEPQNISTIEKTREFKGHYHVLMGALSPLQGIGPDDLKIKGLLSRLTNGVNEVIRDQPQRRWGIHGRVSRASAEAARREGHAHRDGAAGRQRSRLRGRDHDASRARRTARGLVLPATFELPAAIVLVFAGAVACFAGYRLFRVVLAIYEFILGAMLASSVMGISNQGGMIVAARSVGGILGALLFTFAYYACIGLIGAGMGTFCCTSSGTT
jgi:recombination protein RecR